MSTPSPAQSDEESPMATIYPFPVRTGHIEVQSEPEPQSEVIEAEIVGGPETPGTELAIPALPWRQRPDPKARTVRTALKSTVHVPEARDARIQARNAVWAAFFHHVVLGLGRGFKRPGVTWWRWVHCSTWRERDVKGKTAVSPKDTAKEAAFRAKVSAIALLIVGVVASVTYLLASAALLMEIGLIGMLLAWFVGIQPRVKVREETLSGFRTSSMGSVADYKAAFVAAGLMKDDEPLIAIVAPRKDGAGVYAELGLKPGLTAKKVIARRAEVASGLSVDSTLMDVSKGKRGDAHVCIWAATDDPFETSVAFPLAKYARFDAWKPAPFGVDMRGRKVDLCLLWSSMLVGGKPGSGKSFSMRVVATPFVLDPNTQVICFNAKGGSDWSALSLIAHRYGNGMSDEVALQLLDVLRELILEIDRRSKVVEAEEAAGRNPEGKLTPELSRDRAQNMPLTLVVIDEVQEFFKAKLMVKPLGGGKSVKLGVEIRDAVETVIKTGRFLGIILLAGTQRPSHNVMPTDIRSMFGTRFGLRMMDSPSSDMVLGDGMASQGYDSSELDAEYRGVGILVPDAETKSAVQGNPAVGTYFMANGDWRMICERAKALRESMGLLTGYAAGERPEGHEDVIASAEEVEELRALGVGIPKLLERILEYVEDDDREYVPSEELIAELELDMDTVQLGKLFSEWGVETMRRGRGARKGPVIASIKEVARDL